MKLKTLIIVVALLAAVSVTVHFLTRPPRQAPADPRVGQPLITRTAVEQAHTVRLSENGKSVTLTKGAGNTWHIAEYYEFPADFTKLSRLVSDLTSAKLERLVTQNPSRIAALEFKDTGITISDGAGKETWSIKLGKYADGGGRFVRFGDENKAFLTRVNTYLDVEPKNWADTNLLSLKPEDIASVELSFPTENKTITATRAKKEDAFTSSAAPAGKRLKSDRIASLISSVGSLRYSDTSDLTDPNAIAAKAHDRTVKFKTFDGKSVTVTLGRKPEQKVIKAPEAKKDGSTGPTALGSVADLAKSNESAGHSGSTSGTTEKTDDKKGPAKVAETVETIPAGPVFVVVSNSDASAPVNALMKKRAFQVYESTFTGLPASEADLFEDAPAAPAPATPAKSTAPAP